MRNQVLLFAGAAVSAIALASAAHAQGMTGGSINARLDEAGDYRLAGADIRASGRVAGTLRVAGADFRGETLEVGRIEGAAADFIFTGRTGQGGAINAADVRWTGESGGDLRFNAADFVFDGDVDGRLNANIADGRVNGTISELSLNAADLELGESLAVTGDARINAASLTLRGEVDGMLDASARTIRIAGRAGQVDLYADPGRRPRRDTDGLVEIAGEIGGGAVCARTVVISGTVGGPLEVIADEQPRLESGASADSVSFTPRDGRRCERA
jgi:hypothetical protein